MNKSIETIWEEDFLKSDASVAPKLTLLYKQKSEYQNKHYSYNNIFNLAYVSNMPYMGIPMF